MTGIGIPTEMTGGQTGEFVCLSVLVGIIAIVVQVILIVALWRAMKAHESIARSMEAMVRAGRAEGGGLPGRRQE